MTVDITNDYFCLFGLSRGYDLDLAALESAYQKIQGFVHPDRHAQADAGLRREVMQKSAFVNEAYQTLKSPLARGFYLLELNGFDKVAQTNALDESFLIEQMEAREFLSEVRSTVSPLAQLKIFQEDLNKRIKAGYERVSENFKLCDYCDVYKDLLKQQFLKKICQESQDMELMLQEEEN